MLLGRNAELSKLQNIYDNDSNTFIFIYGRIGIGKTALIKEFIKDKEYIYHCAVSASAKQQAELFEAAIQTKNEKWLEDDVQTVKLIVIEEIQNILKQDKSFIDKVIKLAKGEIYNGKVKILATSSSVSWSESNILNNEAVQALMNTQFIKLKELTYIDITAMFPKYTVNDVMMLYAITGGVPAYLKEFDSRITLKENICKNVLSDGKKLRTEGSTFISGELREAAVYNTILSYMANGADKLNELHMLTGFGRDKISVYLKNLIEREIVDKQVSFEAAGSEHTRKGLYTIKTEYIRFWYKYIFGRESQLELMEKEEFYAQYIEPTLDEFAQEIFIKACTEYMIRQNEMEQLPIKVKRIGRWFGKNGDIDIAAADLDDSHIAAKCSWTEEKFTFEMFEELLYNLQLAGLESDYIYLFARGGFDEELIEFAAYNSKLKLISAKEL